MSQVISNIDLLFIFFIVLVLGVVFGYLLSESRKQK